MTAPVTDQTPPPPADLCADFAARDAYMRHMGFELVAAGPAPGTASLRMMVGHQHMNFNGTCHGGAIFSLADCAFGLASNSHGVLSAGINTHTTFEAGAREGDVLTATAREVSRGRRLGVYHVEVVNQDGTRIAGFTGTVHVTSRPNFDPAEGGN